MENSGKQDPVPDNQVEPLLNRLFDAAEEYAAVEFNNSEIVKGDYGVEIYWGAGKADNVISLTAYNEFYTYVSAGVSNGVSKEYLPLNMTRFENLDTMLDAARGTAESLDPSVLE